MELRFPGMRGAPLAQAQVCQYANTPDADFILDRHPEAGNVWLLGGGSGHAFKHAPAMGELAAEIILEKRPPERRFLLSRPAV
jgi:glycine/D-amino acid oxidase-like deaminating enzyme